MSKPNIDPRYPNEDSRPLNRSTDSLSVLPPEMSSPPSPTEATSETDRGDDRDSYLSDFPD